MVCNRDGCRTASGGAAVGVPDTETVQMTARGGEHCPDCGAFLTSDGICRRCQHGPPRSRADMILDEMGDIFFTPDPRYEGYTHDDLMARLAEEVQTGMDRAQQMADAGRLDDAALSGIADEVVNNMGDVFDAWDEEGARAVAREKLIEGYGDAVNRPSPTASGRPQLRAARLGSSNPTAVAHGNRPGPVTFDGSFWKHEFGDAAGMPLTLSNGETVDVGTRFSGNKHPTYVARVGKKKNLATVGASLLPAIDAIKSHSEITRGGRDLTRVETDDGAVAHYDHLTRQATCTCGENPCKHQMAAMLLGETRLENDGADAERGALWGHINQVLREKAGGGAASTASLVRSADGAYAYLNTVAPTVDFGDDKLEAAVTGQASSAARARNCPGCGAFLSKEGTCAKCGYPNTAAAVEAAVTPQSDEAAPGAVPAATEEGVQQQPQPEPEPEPEPELVPNEATTFLQDLGLQAPVPANDELPAWLQREIPRPDPGFVMTSVAKRILTSMGSLLKMRWGAMKNDFAQTGEWPSRMTGRAWGLYGPPGTGKNTAAREIAATLQVPYVEEDVNAATDFQRLLGEVVLEDGSTKAKLGKVGNALVNGSVVCINEVVSADPAIQTALHQAAQDGILTIPGPEGAEYTYRVHPNSVLVLTWNPAGGMADRPTNALTERLHTLPVPLPSEAEERQMLAARINREYGLNVSPSEVSDDVAMFRAIRELVPQGKLAIEPGFRNLMSFTAMRLATGDPEAAMEQILVTADQDPMSLEATREELKLYLGRYTFAG
jgi:hypothetical protein